MQQFLKDIKINKRTYFRQSTKEYVVEIEMNITNKLLSTYRYSAKTRLLAYIKFILSISSILKDIYQTMKYSKKSNNG